MTDNKQRIKLNPNDLVIDMTLDDDNVALKIESMKRSGMTQDVYVWKQGHRIIDGFHRTAAACELGWDTIDVVVVDCSEEQFWDSRIQSAKQHHKVSEARFADWVIESWNNSEMCEIAKAEMKANVSGKDLELLKKLSPDGNFTAPWGDFVSSGNTSCFSDSDLNELAIGYCQFDDDCKDLYLDFLREKSKVWGISVGEAERIIANEYLSSFPATSKYQDFATREVTKRMGCGFFATAAVRKFMPNMTVVSVPELLDLSKGQIDDYDKAYTDAYINQSYSFKSVEELAAAVSDGANEGVNAIALINHRNAEEREKRQKQDREKAQQEFEKKIKFEKSPEGVRVSRKRERERIQTMLSLQIRNIRLSEREFSDMTDGPAVAADYIQNIVELFKTFWPDVDLPEYSNPLALENKRLRDSLAQAAGRIEHLEKVLETRERTAQQFKDVMVISGE